MTKGAEFRRRALECYRLSTQLRQAEHRSFALDLAKAWSELAKCEERKELADATTTRVVTAADGTILIIAQPEAERPPPEEPIE
jgi:hypothetical protein